MKTIVKILIVFFIVNVNAQQNPSIAKAPFNPVALKYKLEHFNLKGPVKTAHINQYYYYEFNAQKQLEKVYVIDSEGNKTLNEAYFYPNNRTIHKVSYVEDNGWMKTEYTKNEKDYITNFKLLESENLPDYYQIDPMTFEYKNNLLVKEITDKSAHNYSFKNEIATYTYDDNKRLVESRLWSDNEENTGFYNSYDYSNFKDGKITYSRGNGYYIINQTYNQNGTLIDEVVKENGYSANPQSIVCKNPEYDAYGNVVRCNSSSNAYTYF